jgi:hypothetical protein
MKKFILVVLAVFFMSGIASAATTLDLKGQLRVYPEMNNIGRSSGLLPNYLNTGYVGTLGKSSQNVFTDQRARLNFNIKSNENVGATVVFEIDSFWGQSAFTVNRDGTGGGQGSDSVNVEVKNSYMWFKPTADLKIQAGIQTYADDTAGVLVGGGDMAGFRVDYALSRSSSLTASVFTWWQDTLAGSNFGGNNTWKDSVYFIPLTLKQQLGSGTATAFVYTIQDSTKATDASNPTTGNRPFGSGATGLNYDKGEIYYAGLNYGGKAGNVSYFLMGVYNFGTYKGVVTTTSTDDRKVSAFAVNAKVDVKMGDGKLRLQGMYVSGTDVSSDKTKFGGFVTGDQYSGHQTMPMLQDDMILLVQNTDVISNATTLTGNPNNNNDGLGVAYGAFDYNLTQKLNAKAVAGYATADKQNNSARLGKQMGQEYNAQLIYKFDENLTIKGVYSYAKLGDYFKTATLDPDNAYRLLIKFIYLF